MIKRVCQSKQAFFILSPMIYFFFARYDILSLTFSHFPMRTCAELFGRYRNRLKNLTRRQKFTSIFLVLSLAIGMFLIPGEASATVGEEFTSWVTQIWLWLASLGIQLAIFFLKFFILLAGYNGYINADIVKFGWNIVRDVANMFFIVILLVIAFGTILGLEQYEWKKSLPKLVFAAIFVNFSNVICQLIIDVSQVFTITFLNAVAGTAGGNLISLMKFDNVFELVKNDPGGDIRGELFIGALMAMIFCLIAAATIGSYVIVMLYRVVTLWCLIILSPLAFLFSILPSTKSYADEFWKEFTNHVIAAPMMVFFLWLAFATFGAGDVVTDNLQAHNSLVGYSLDSVGADADAVAAQGGGKVSNSAATTWLNFANFAVAIGFLLIGLERVQKLGVKGGDYIQRGVGFAKNVLTIAAGVRLGSYALDKGKGAVGSTAMFALNKAPVIGGDSLRRKGRTIKSLAQFAGNRINIKRDDARQKLEEKFGVKGNMLASMLLLNSGARKEKIAKKWEQAAEESFKEWDERVSTSKTKAGETQLRQTLRLQLSEELSAEGKRNKFAKTREDLLKTGEFANLEQKTRDKGAEADVMEGLQAERKRQALAESKERLLESNGGDNAFHDREARAAQLKAQADIIEGLDAERKRQALAESKEATLNDKAFHDREIRSSQLSAQSDILEGKLEAGEHKLKSEYKAVISGAIKDEDLTEKEKIFAADRAKYKPKTWEEAQFLAGHEEANKKVIRGTEMDNAMARDAVLVAQNLSPRFVDALVQKHRKEDDELRGSSSYDRVQANLNDVYERLTNAPADSVEKKQLQTELASLMSFAQSRGMIFGGGSMNTINSKFGDKVKGVAADDILAAQARTLSPIIGRAVDATPDGVKQAFLELQKNIGDEQQFLAFMRNLKDNCEAQASEGAITQAGLFKEVKINGKYSIELTDAVDDKKFIDGKRDFSVDRANFSVISSMKGAVDTERRSDGVEIIKVSTQKARDNVISMFGNLTTESADKVKDAIIREFNSIIENTNKNDLDRLLTEFKDKVDVDALRIMFKRTNLKNSAAFNDQYDQSFKNAHQNLLGP